MKRHNFLAFLLCSESKFENIYTLEQKKKKNAQKEEGNMLRILATMNERVSMASSYYRILDVSVGHRCCFVRS